MKSLIRMELNEIERHKWIESEKAGYDLGEQAAFDWVNRYEDDFLNAYATYMQSQSEVGNLEPDKHA